MSVTRGRWAAVMLAGWLALGMADTVAMAQNGRETEALRPTSLFWSKRGDLEVEILPLSNNGFHGQYLIYLVDRARKEILPNLEEIPAQRVYQCQVLSSDIPPVCVLDDRCRLIVLTAVGKTATVACYAPSKPLSPSFLASEISDPEAWMAALGAIDAKFTFPNQYRLFGPEHLGSLPKVSTDVLIPEVVKQEQRQKLRSAIAALLNARLATWRESLDDIANANVTAERYTVQEVWLAKDTRLARKGIAAGSAPDDPYWQKLRMLNRVVLSKLLAIERIPTAFRADPNPVWVADLAKAKDRTNYAGQAALDNVCENAQECVIRLVPDNRVQLFRGDKAVQVILDLETSRFVAPMMEDELSVADVPTRVGSCYSGRLQSFGNSFTLKVITYAPDSRAFTGEILWDFAKTPNRIRGELANGALTWREYRDVGGAELPGGVFTVDGGVGASASLTFETQTPDIDCTRLKGEGKLELLPRPSGQEASSPHSGQTFPEAPSKTVVYPGLPEFVRKLVALGQFDTEITREELIGRRIERTVRRSTVAVNSVSAPYQIKAYCGEAVEAWSLTVGPPGEAGTGGAWTVDRDTLVTYDVRVPLPRIPTVVRYRPKYHLPMDEGLMRITSVVYYLGAR